MRHRVIPILQKRKQVERWADLSETVFTSQPATVCRPLNQRLDPLGTVVYFLSGSANVILLRKMEKCVIPGGGDMTCPRNRASLSGRVGINPRQTLKLVYWKSTGKKENCNCDALTIIVQTRNGSNILKCREFWKVPFESSGREFSRTFSPLSLDTSEHDIFLVGQ